MANSKVLKFETKEITTNGTVKYYRGKPVMFIQDFIDITGIDIRKNKLFFRPEFFNNEPRKLDFNAVTVDSKLEAFMYKSGVEKAILLLGLNKKMANELLSYFSAPEKTWKQKRINDRMVVHYATNAGPVMQCRG